MAPVHVLIVPKQHIMASVAEADGGNSAVIARIFEAAAEIAQQLKLENGFRIVTNAGADAGQTVAHLQFHLLGGQALGPQA